MIVNSADDRDPNSSCMTVSTATITRATHFTPRRQAPDARAGPVADTIPRRGALEPRAG
jgi:hypothetical protein